MLEIIKNAFLALTTVKERAPSSGVLATLIATINYLIGGFDIISQTLLIFVLLDYILWVIAAKVNKELNSQKGTTGLVKKIFLLLLIVVPVMLDRLLGTGNNLRNIFCYFIIANEGISICENAARMGIPLPKKLIESLEQLKEGGKKEIKRED